MWQVLGLVVGAAEFEEVPVRHNEDRINGLLARDVRWPLPKGWGMDSPHAKAHLLLQVCPSDDCSGGMFQSEAMV